jgi:hypothetical protein
VITNLTGRNGERIDMGTREHSLEARKVSGGTVLGLGSSLDPSSSVSIGIEHALMVIVSHDVTKHLSGAGLDRGKSRRSPMREVGSVGDETVADNASLGS